VIFTLLNTVLGNSEAPSFSSRTREKPSVARLLRDLVSASAPIPVIRLWTGCTRLKTHVVTNCYFLLTIKIESVETESFFDNFLSFSGWCGVPGLKRSHPFIAK
jgi:hypothetical protein